MALQGSLGNLGLADLLQTGLSGQVGGTLTLRQGPERARLYVSEEGIRVLEPQVIDAQEVLQAFLHRGVLYEAQVEAATGGGMVDADLLDRMVAGGLLREGEIEELLGTVAEDVLLDLLGWSAGTFRFEEEPLATASLGLLGRVPVDSGGVLLRAAQRIDERRSVQETLGRNPTLFVGLPGELPKPLDDDGLEERLHPLLDGRIPLSEIALALGVGRFAVARALAHLVVNGAARPASPQELAAALDQARLRVQPRLARSIALQWSEQVPTDPAPLRALVEIARLAASVDDEVDALRALALQQLSQGAATEAVSTLLEALGKAPNDETVQEELRAAAREAGDDVTYAYGTRLLAEAALHQQDGDRALSLLEPLLRSAPTDLEVRLMHARALVQSSRRRELADAAEAVAGLLGRACRRRRDREIASWFRDAVAHMCPERGDLLRRFRLLYEGQGKAPRRVAILAALVGLVAAAGFVLTRGPSATDLLARAQQALDDGRPAEAQLLLAELVEAHPDTPEAEEAYQLQATLAGSLKPSSSDPNADAEQRQRITDTAGEVPRLLAEAPTQAGVERLSALAARIETARTAGLRAAAFEILLPALQDYFTTRLRAVRENLDLLQMAVDAPRTLRGNRDGMSDFLKRCERLPTEADVDLLVKVSDVLQRIVRAAPTGTLTSQAREYDRTLGVLARRVRERGDNLVACQVALVALEIEEAERQCREDAPRKLAMGAIDEAEAAYERLDTLLQRLEGKPEYERVLLDARRRRLPDLVRERRGQFAEIRNDLAAAQAAERSGDLEAAAAAYAGLVKKYWSVRMESVFTLPMEVTSVPEGAAVEVNGVPAGKTPCIVRYALRSQTTVTLRAEGYDAETRLLDTEAPQPPTRIAARLRPARIWAAPVEATGRSAPVSSGGDLVFVDRSGRVSLIRRRDGNRLWARHYQSLEGVRARCAADDRRIYVAQVDGTLLVLRRDDGSRLAEHRGARPIGDVALVDRVAGVATDARSMVLFSDAPTTRTVELRATATAGTVAAHGLFWVGTAEGTVFGVDPEGRVAVEYTLGSKGFPVVAVAGTPDGVLSVTSNGTLALLSPDGRLRWEREAVGDPSGPPAQTGTTVGLCDRRGRVVLFRASDGAPLGSVELGREAVGGLRATAQRLIASLSDGRLWIYDPDALVTHCEAPLAAPPHFPPEPLGSDAVAVSDGVGNLSLLRLP